MRSVLLLISLYLLLVFVLPLLLTLVVSFRSLPVGRACPQCGDEETIPLISALLRFATRYAPGAYERRWCLGCGWEGVVRPGQGTPVRRRALPGPAITRRARTLDLRLLTIDGEPWRVMLQCWTEPGRCYGRLVFVAPTGRLWTDAMHPITGRSPDEVLGQALSLPERALASRLREVASE